MTPATATVVARHTERTAEGETAPPAELWRSRAWAATRIALGWVFLWAFADKLLGLGFSTAPARAWVAGGSPAVGFLKNATHGPFAAFFQGIAGNPAVDGLFMTGLLAVGLALVLGVGLRIAGYAGAAMMMLMYTAAMPPTTNPVVDDHIVYALVLLALPLADAGRRWGLGRWWECRTMVQRHPILR